MRLAKTILLSHCFLFVFIFSSNAKHIIGGELSYRSLGNNKYEITIRVYRDCSIEPPIPFDNPLYLAVFDSAGNVIQNPPITFPGSSVLPINSGNGCLTAPPNLCVDEAIYIDTLNLPPIPGGYTIAYQRCCRNSTIFNIVDAASVGATYFATIPDSSLAYNNSSPVFNNFPPIIICVNNPLSVDQSATDPDGDSLAYSLYNPFSGGSVAEPEPIPESPPPYMPVTFNPPYTYLNPIGGTVPLSINAKTGLLTGTPNTIGQFVVGICVKEYRNGRLLGIHYRDFQFNVLSCSSISSIVSAFVDTVTGNRVTFNSGASIDATSYRWDFGNGDTDNVANPVHIYNTAGSYNVCLTIHNDSGCYSIQCHTVDISVSTNVLPVSLGNSRFTVYPNPCNTCFISGTDNLNDISISDVLGRKINATLTKTATGAQINMNANQTGFFFVRNLKTGQVIKFIREN